MKKEMIIGFLLLFCYQWSIAQTAEFEIVLRVTDAVGNKDSIIIGHDPNANAYELNPHLGEIDIRNQPCQHPIDLRGFHREDGTETKKIILRYSNCDALSANHDLRSGAGPELLHIKADYMPVTFSWDTVQLNNGPTAWCHSESILYNSHIIGHFDGPNQDIHLIGPPDLPALYYMNKTNFVEEGFNNQPAEGLYMTHFMPRAGGIVDTVPTMFLIFRTDNWYYPDATSTMKEAPLLVYPNPCTNYLMAKIEESLSFTVLNSLGQVMSVPTENIGDMVHWNTKQLPTGIYYLMAQNRRGGFSATKFLKL